MNDMEYRAGSLPILAIPIGQAGSVARQAAENDEVTSFIDDRDGMTRRECDDHSAPNSIAPRATP
jgi:hypothetical protein